MPDDEFAMAMSGLSTIFKNRRGTATTFTIKSACMRNMALGIISPKIIITTDATTVWINKTTAVDGITPSHELYIERTGSSKNIAIKVAYSTLMMLLPTSVVVRKVSGFSLKKASDLDTRDPFLLSISSFSRFAETKAISEPEKKPLAKTVSIMIINSKQLI